MNRIFRQLWRIRRLIVVWLLLTAIASIYWLREHAGLRTVDDYNRFAKGAIIDVLWTGLIVAICFTCFLIVKRLQNRSQAGLPATFENKPWLFDRKLITLTGKVTRILPNDWDDSLKRRSRNILRLMTRDPETIGRYRHLRFLLSSSALKRGEELLILHNLDALEVDLGVGDWVEVCGEYVHHRGRRRGFFGSKLTRYGRLHYTHEPKGYLRVLPGPPENKPRSIGRIGR